MEVQNQNTKTIFKLFSGEGTAKTNGSIENSTNENMQQT